MRTGPFPALGMDVESSATLLPFAIKTRNWDVTLNPDNSGGADHDDYIISALFTFAALPSY